MNGFKKFFWWLNGFLSSFVLVAGAAAIVVFAIPAGVFVQNNEEYLDKDLQNMNLFTLFTQIQDIQIGQVPILKKALQDFVEQNQLDRYVAIDWAAFDDIAFGDLGNAKEALANAVEVVATLDSLEVMPELGALGELPVFQNFDPLTPEAQQALDKTSPDFVPELYYFRNGDRYEKVFDDHLDVRPEAAGQTYYYPALKSVNLLDLIKIAPQRLIQERVRNIVETGAAVEEGSLLDVVLKDYSISDLSTLNPEELANGIQLSAFFPVEGNETLYDVLIGATGFTGNPADLSVGDLNQNIDVDRVPVSAILGDYQTNPSLFDLLLGATARPDATAENLNLGDIKSLDVNRVKIESVLGEYETNPSLYDILLSGIARPEGSEPVTPGNLNIGDLKTLQVAKIKLEAVLPKGEGNATLYSILSSATGVPESELTLSSLENFDATHVKVVDVIPYQNDLGEYVNQDFYRLVKAVANVSTDEEVKQVNIAQLSSMDTKNVALSAVLDPAENKNIYDLLLSAIPLEEGDVRLELTAENLTVGDLSRFDVNRVSFSNFLDEKGNPTLAAILKDATGKTNFSDIVVGDMQSESTFQIGRIHLSHFLGEAESGSLSGVLSDLAGKEFSALLIDDLKGLDINALHLSSVLDAPNPSLQDILVQATGSASFADVTLGKLSSGFDLGKISLSSVLSDVDPNLKSLLADAAGKPFETLTIADLSAGFDLNAIKLSSVLSAPEEKLRSFLEQATGKAFAEIRLGDLGGPSFSTDRVKLTSFLPATPENKGLYDCLKDALGVASPDDITIGSLNGGFRIENIKLSTVMSSSSSSLVQSLIDKGATLGNLGETIDQLTLYEVYGKNCFSPKASVSLTGDKYKAVTDPSSGKITSYVYDSSLVDDPNDDQDGVYYLSGNASFWALLCFDTTQSDPTNGRGLTYQINAKAFSDLEGNAAGQALEQATIYELIATGLLRDSGYNDRVKAMSVKQILDYVAMIP